MAVRIVSEGESPRPAEKNRTETIHQRPDDESVSLQTPEMWSVRVECQKCRRKQENNTENTPPPAIRLPFRNSHAKAMNNIRLEMGKTSPK